ncbi:MAG: hypothetical protein NT021_00390 [Sphingobacteriales bacterium]|jgi:hypothetical protein|nr:hypothetical protein [Sphingobacteriales bacterium]
MNDFDLLKDIWQSQPERKLAAEEILKQVKRSKNRLANKLLFEVFVMSLAIAALSYAWYMVPFKMWTTHLSLVIFMASCLFALFAQLSAYRSIHATAHLIGKPDTYIKYLKQYQKDRHRLNTQKYKVYTLFLGIGLVLFFVEIFFVATLWFTVSSFVASLIWIAVCYFWLMKAYIRKEDGYLNGMIASLEHLERQFEQD